MLKLGVGSGSFPQWKSTWKVGSGKKCYKRGVTARKSGLCVKCTEPQSMLSFFSSRPNWASPPPHPQASGPTPRSGGRGTLACTRGGPRGVGSPTGQILWYSRHILVCTLHGQNHWYSTTTLCSMRLFLSSWWRELVKTRGGHRHLQIVRMLDIDLISEPPHAPSPQIYVSKVWESVWPKVQ